MKIQSMMKLSNINIRREKEGDGEGPVAIDLSVNAQMIIDNIAELFSTPESFAVLVTNLYADTGELKSGDLASMKLKREWANVKTTITIDALEEPQVITLDDCELNEIKLELKAGRVCDVKARVQCKPSKEVLADLSQHLHESLSFEFENVVVQEAQQKLDLEAASEAA